MNSKTSLLLLTCLWLATCCLLADGKLSIDRIRACLEQKLNGKKFRKAKEKSFNIVYGEAALEIFHLFSQHEMKQLELLAECVRFEDSAHFLPADSPKHMEGIERRYGGSNVTRLTGIAQEVVPEVVQTIRQEVQKYLKKIGWETKKLGIRTFEFLDFDKGGMEEHLESIREEKAKKERESAIFVIGGGSDPAAEEAKRLEKEAMEKKKHLQMLALKDTLYSHPETVYTVYCQFSDRSQFLGGELQYSALGPAGGDGDGEEYDDDEEEKVVQAKHAEYENRNFPKPIVDSIATEKGNLLLLNRNFAFALDRILAGRRKGLLLELWAYRDSPVSSSLVSAEEGRALGLMEEEQEL